MTDTINAIKEFEVSSDGGQSGFEEAMRLCQETLGYGEDFRIDEEESMSDADKCRKKLNKVFGCDVVCFDLTPAPVNNGVDTTESARRQMVAEIISKEEGRAELEKEYGQVWNTEELSRDYSVEGFMAPYVVVRRRVDGKRGTLTFRHSPRFYWGFEEEC